MNHIRSMKHVRVGTISSLLFLSAVSMAQTPAPTRCSANPAEAWEQAQTAVKSGDAGRVMLTLTPEKRARESSSYAVGAHMVLSLSELAGDLSKKPDAARKAKEAEKKLSLELDALLKKNKAPSITQIGKPIMQRVYAPEVLKLFSSVDHVAFARDMEKFFVKVEAAAKDAGVKSESPPKLDELVVGFGTDLASPLGAPQTSGDTSNAVAGKTSIQFKKISGCWLVDGRPEK